MRNDEIKNEINEIKKWENEIKQRFKMLKKWTYKMIFNNLKQ